MPKHRGAAPEPAVKRALRTSLTYSGVAVAATGIAVSSGVAMKQGPPSDTAAATVAAAQADRGDHRPDQDAVPDRTIQASRSKPRVPAARAEQAERPPRDERASARPERAPARAEAPARDLRAVARSLMAKYGLSEAEFGCLDALWVSESNWDPQADNPTSSAYGIPQALTGGTHRNLPADYRTNPVSQIEWGLWYIANSYGSACAAWEFKQANNWY